MFLNELISGYFSSGTTDCTSSAATENLPPPSEWLEETLINLYLSGYNQASNAAEGLMMSLEMDESDSGKISADGNDDIHMVGEASRDEENWRAQYGQVVQPAEGPVPNILSLDLWDWEMVRDCRKDGKGQVARLVGWLVKRSAKLHPSLPSSGGLLRTAPICEAHLDLDKCIGCVIPVQDTWPHC
uniref:Uncharacterized protein n=1 Tax=Rhizophora mucronata TaxID=61149 RepID=A0A2P2K6H6_RHIMU